MDESSGVLTPLDQQEQRAKVLTWLTNHLPAERLSHVLRVEQTAVELAQHYHLNWEQAAQAGLMHDLAKCWKPSQLLAVAQAEAWELDPVEKANPHLLHAAVGAIVAKTEFGVQDQAVLQAISNHTLGRPGMSLLSCVVFLADSLEPGRGNTPELETLRQASWHNLYQGVALVADYSLKHLIHTRRLIHPRTVLTRNWALQLSKATDSEIYQELQVKGTY
ncbi:MAG: bis(5'-nucleosyl)-tetraphosphatase (symmetrical) YqeK [Leptolyngbyaceae bacterium]|nr:bis(5'-nucleosyl)-tetraphosphatase (symmetrical) YqeK [Leptolyngbyaceae bacterium]